MVLNVHPDNVGAMLLRAMSDDHAADHSSGAHATASKKKPTAAAAHPPPPPHVAGPPSPPGSHPGISDGLLAVVLASVLALIGFLILNRKLLRACFCRPAAGPPPVATRTPPGAGTGTGAKPPPASKPGLMRSMTSKALLLEKEANPDFDPVQELAKVNQFRDARDQSVFTSHVRTFAAFSKSNLDPTVVLPPGAPPERAPIALSTSVLYHVLFGSRHTADALWDSIGAGFLAAALSSLFWLAKQQPDDTSSFSVSALDITDVLADEALAVFKLLPAFLILGLLGFVTARWRGWLENMHTVRGRIANVGLAVGGAVANPDDPEVRALLYRIYRYLNCIQAMIYAPITPELPQSNEGYLRLGLLTETEVRFLAPMGKKNWDTVLAWVGSTVEELVRTKQVRETAVNDELIYKLRAICSNHNNLFLQDMPNSWYGMAKFVVDLLVTLLLVGLSLEVDKISHFSSNPQMALIYLVILVWFCSVIMAAAYWLPWSIILELNQPFSRQSDDHYHVDTLLCTTEQTIFANLRALFDLRAARAADAASAGVGGGASPNKPPAPPGKSASFSTMGGMKITSKK